MKRPTARLVGAMVFGAAPALACDPLRFIDPPGRQQANVLMAFVTARAVVLGDPVSTERYAVDGAHSGLAIRLRVARNYKGPFQVGDVITVEAFNACVAPTRPIRRLLYFLCGGEGTTTRYCYRSMDLRIEVPGDRATLDRIIDPPLQEIRLDPRLTRAPGAVP